MRWQGERESENIEDRRGMGGRGIAIGGGLGGVIVLLLALLFGADPGQLLQQSPQGDEGTQTSRSVNPQEAEVRKFVGVVLAQTEDAWSGIFRQMGKEYRKPTLVLFSDRTDSGCGTAASATGPFYCPQDEKLYIDLSFFRELTTRFPRAGRFCDRLRRRPRGGPSRVETAWH